MELDPRTEEQIKLLCDGRNRDIRDILTETDVAIHVEALAEQLVDQDIDVVDTATYDELLEATSVELHHNRLPKLAEVDLVNYDPDTNLVSQTSVPGSMVDWIEEGQIPSLLTTLGSAQRSNEEGVGVLKGLDAAFEYGRKLADEAEEELFTLYVTTDLLEEECLRHGESALNRGVEIFIGSQNHTVRQKCRDGLPEATVWEPQLDWLNAPSYPRVGRLILMDRRKVMLSFLEAPPSEDEPLKETALVGTGEDNPLVVLVRELLGPRLDHLDFQSTEFQTQLQS